MNEGEHRALMIIVSAAAGSLASIWFRNWKQMPWTDIVFAFVVGFSFAIFVVPWAVADIMGVDIGPLRVACATTFLGAAFGIPLMPLIQRKVEGLLRLKKDDEA